MTAHCRSRAARGCPKIRCTEAMRSSPSIGRPSSPTRKSTFFWGVARPVCPVHDGGTWLKTAMVSIGRRLAADQPAGFKVCAQLLKLASNSCAHLLHTFGFLTSSTCSLP